MPNQFTDVPGPSIAEMEDVNSKVDSYYKSLSSTTDFNSITTNGIYYFIWVANGATYNRPVNQGGQLIVCTEPTSNVRTQIYTSSSGTFFVRGYHDNAWESWKQMATQDQITSVTTGIISKASGITSGTLDNATLYKVGNTVFASGRIHTLGDVPTNQTFFSIPSEFRPKRATIVTGYMFIKMNDVDFGARPVPATVNTSGGVSYAYSSQATADQVFFSGSWSVL